MRKLLALVCVVCALAAGLFVLGVYLHGKLTPSDDPDASGNRTHQEQPLAGA